MRLLQTGVDAFCSKRGLNYLDLLSVGESCPGDAMVRAMSKSAARRKTKIPLRQLMYKDANASIGA